MRKNAVDPLAVLGPKAVTPAMKRHVANPFTKKTKKTPKGTKGKQVI